jgi:hypothetical protein
MTEADSTHVPSLSLPLTPEQYRHLDRASKLLGVGLVALGLDAGGDTVVGLALGVVGAAVALTTVFVRKHEYE